MRLRMLAGNVATSRVYGAEEAEPIPRLSCNARSKAEQLALIRALSPEEKLALGEDLARAAVAMRAMVRRSRDSG